MSQLDGAEVKEVEEAEVVEEYGLRRTLCTLKIITKFSYFLSCHLGNFALSQQETESSQAKLKARIFKCEASEKGNSVNILNHTCGCCNIYSTINKHE